MVFNYLFPKMSRAVIEVSNQTIKCQPGLGYGKTLKFQAQCLIAGVSLDLF